MTSDPEPLDDEVVDARPRDERPQHYAHIEALFLKEYVNLVRHLATRTRSVEEAREIASEAFAKLLALRFPTTVESFRKYLYKTASNLAMNQRLRSVKPSERFTASGAEYPLAVPAPEIEGAYIRDEQLAVVTRTVDAQPRERGIAMRLRHGDDLTYKEIVARLADMGIKVNERTVRRWIEDIQDRCRDAIQAYRDPETEGKK